eukprot:TRINITY_DN14959_c0_g2_i2.p1 TRINITY_DN14959_c0_g2~~TRINITY_DN14959_c0_g2_i2.p1  ORF type:complete len:720 (+),score=277.62 TRINITY_DN14959_c0_g2_i2:202-2361(+)
MMHETPESCRCSAFLCLCLATQHPLRCLVDLDRMGREVTQLSNALSNMLTEDVIQQQREAEEATRSISKLHQKKHKLDSCQDTLSKTVYLRENVHSLDKAFAEGNTSNIASEINKMQQALEAVRGFGQFDKLAGSIAEYEEKLQEMVEAECVDALLNRDKDRAKEHLATLKKIGRLGEILVQYTKRAVQGVANEWRDFEAAHPTDSDATTQAWDSELAAFLAGFNQRLENTLASSKRYYVEVFGSDAAQVTLEYFTAVQRDTAHRQARFLKKASLPVLVDCYQNSMRLLHTIIEAHFPQPTAATAEAQDMRASQLEMLRQAASGPYRHLQSIYPEMEEAHLRGIIHGLRFVKDLANTQRNIRINPTMVMDMTEGTSTLLHECQLAVERCILFTSGDLPTQAKTLELFGTLNDVLVHFSQKILEVVTRLRVGLGLKAPAGAGEGAEEGSRAAPPPPTDHDTVKLKLTLQLHHAAEGVAVKILLFDTWLHEHVAGLKRDEATTPLKKFVESADRSDEGGIFATAKQEAKRLGKTVESIVFDLLFSPVAARLTATADLPRYRETVSDSYTAYSAPMEALPVIGDYLLSLPEALGQALTGLENEDSSTWIVLILHRTSDLFLEQVMQIPQLTPQGVQQLSTDAGYVHDLMNAFNLTVPSLRALLLVLQAPNDLPSIQTELLETYPKGRELFDLVQAKMQAALQSSSPTGQGGEQQKPRVGGRQ